MLYGNRLVFAGGHGHARGWDMDRGNPSNRVIIKGFRGLLLLWACLALTSCAREVVPVPPPLPTYPGKVLTEDGMAFYVRGIRLPGTRQELLLKTGGTQTWVPLNIIHGVRFLGPEKDRYRESEVYLTSGEKLRGQVFVGGLLEGTTDLGYWNMPLKKVERFQIVGE